MDYVESRDKGGDDLCWYAIHTKPREEDRALSNLMAWHVETFAPKIRQSQRSQLKGKPAYSVRPLFPNYIFARFQLINLHKIRFTRGVQNVVGFGGQVAPVDDAAIELIR